jgi:predicted nucleotidyltransferase
MLDIDPRKPVDLLAYCGIINAIEDMFVVPVDVSERVRLHPGVREAAERDALYAF